MDLVLDVVLPVLVLAVEASIAGLIDFASRTAVA